MTFTENDLREVLAGRSADAAVPAALSAESLERRGRAARRRRRAGAVAASVAAVAVAAAVPGTAGDTQERTPVLAGTPAPAAGGVDLSVFRAGGEKPSARPLGDLARRSALVVTGYVRGFDTRRGRTAMALRVTDWVRGGPADRVLSVRVDGLRPGVTPERLRRAVPPGTRVIAFLGEDGRSFRVAGPHVAFEESQGDVPYVVAAPGPLAGVGDARPRTVQWLAEALRLRCELPDPKGAPSPGVRYCDEGWLTVGCRGITSSPLPDQMRTVRCRLEKP
ncbi:hypothetical protein ACSNOI_09155 [Actinomadura kijaniata]|uniref:hypothetical protein n=1 Tax=Actinomadura kijaniata TaxID=46161 RepID=UPI003F1CAF4E